MKVIQIPFCFHPDSIGGTEVYVEALSHHLQERGVQVVVAAPAEQDAAYVHQGLPVRRYAVSQTVADLRELYDEGDMLAAENFARILDEEHPDLVHLHAFTRGVSLRLVWEAKQRHIPVVFTYHTPTVSCQRGTLMRWGTEICDGMLDLDTCTRCTLQGLGLSRRAAGVVGRVPVAVGELLGMARRRGGMWTALRMCSLIKARHDTFHTFMAEVDQIIAVCQWVKDLLVRNGILPTKITLSRQGLAQDPKSEFRNPNSEIQLAFLGRLDPTKGPHVLIQALRMAPELPINLDIYGVVQGKAGDSYQRRLEALAAGDPRIAFHSPVPPDQVVSLLHTYDLLAVPSRCRETGPMVVLEAFAAGIPIVGSNLGGIAELVEDGVNGLLVEAGSSEAWCQTFRHLSENRELRTHLQAGIRSPRTMKQVAEEMLALYATI